jgi:glycosyltransferase involved in cell wall biosynthesis
MVTPQVSILMPVFNGEHLLERALQSILKQSFANFEIIILDNLSTDSTPLICQRLAEQDERINYVLDTRQRTTHEAANYLMGMAQRELCISASDDDLWEPELLEVLISLIEADPAAGIAVANCRSIDLDDRYVGRPFLRKREILLLKLGPFFFWWSYLVKRNVVPIIFALFRTEVWKSSSSFTTFDWTGADVDNLFVLSVAKDHRIVITEKVLFGYRAKTRPKPPGKKNTFWSENWNHYRYFVPHQALFTRKLIHLLRNSKFNSVQRNILYLRTIWSFLAQILFMFQIGFVLNILRRDRKNKLLDVTIASTRMDSLEQQKNITGYLWMNPSEEGENPEK